MIGCAYNPARVPDQHSSGRLPNVHSGDESGRHRRWSAARGPEHGIRPGLRRVDVGESGPAGQPPRGGRARQRSLARGRPRRNDSFERRRLDVDTGDRQSEVRSLRRPLDGSAIRRGRPGRSDPDQRGRPALVLRADPGDGHAQETRLERQPVRGGGRRRSDRDERRRPRLGGPRLRDGIDVARRGVGGRAVYRCGRLRRDCHERRRSRLDAAGHRHHRRPVRRSRGTGRDS